MNPRDLTAVVLIILGVLVLLPGVGMVLWRTVDESLQALKQRLARGEITRDQYEDLRQVLDRT